MCFARWLGSRVVGWLPRIASFLLSTLPSFRQQHTSLKHPLIFLFILIHRSHPPSPPSNLLSHSSLSLFLWLPHFLYTLHASVGGWKSSVVPPFDVLYILSLPYTLLLRVGICVSSLTSFLRRAILYGFACRPLPSCLRLRFGALRRVFDWFYSSSFLTHPQHTSIPPYTSF